MNAPLPQWIPEVPPIIPEPIIPLLPLPEPIIPPLPLPEPFIPPLPIPEPESQGKVT